METLVVSRARMIALLVVLVSSSALAEPALRVLARHDDEDQSPSVVALLDGEKELARETLDEDGNVLKVKGTFSDGVLPLVSDSGKALGSVTYASNAREGEALRLFKSGQVKVKSRYRAGKKEGLEEHFAKDGSRKELVPYKGGLIHGTMVFHHASGVVSGKAAYVAGKRHGEEEFFDEAGALTNAQTYVDDVAKGPPRCFAGGKRTACARPWPPIAPAWWRAWPPPGTRTAS